MLLPQRDCPQLVDAFLMFPPSFPYFDNALDYLAEGILFVSLQFWFAKFTNDYSPSDRFFVYASLVWRCCGYIGELPRKSSLHSTQREGPLIVVFFLLFSVESLWYFHFFFNAAWSVCLTTRGILLVAPLAADLRCFTLASFPRVASGCFFLSCSSVVLEEFRWPMLRFMNSSISVMPFLTSTEMFRWTLHFLKVASNFLSSFPSLFLSVRWFSLPPGWWVRLSFLVTRDCHAMRSLPSFSWPFVHLQLDGAFQVTCPYQVYHFLWCFSLSHY